MRDSYFDNAKFLLIALVVIGHTIELQALKSDPLNALYLLIYTFHMPVFVMISGYFAKNYKKSGRIKKLAVQLLVPYLIFNILVALPDIRLNFVYPSWTLWFILSLFSWNLLLLLFVRLKHPVVVSVLIALGVGYLNFDVELLSLSRTFTFFPFFLAGFYLKREHLNFVSSSTAKILGSMLIICVLVAMYYFAPDLRWFTLKHPYALLGRFEWYAAVYRLTVYLLAALVAVSFLSLVPTKEVFFTKFGPRTLTVYLLHTFAIRALYLGAKAAHIALNDVVLVCFGIVVAFVLSTRFVQTASKPLIEPNVFKV